MVELYIKEIGVKGDGLATYNDEHIFVDRALAHESVDAKIYKTKDGISRATIQNIITTSPDRSKPPCPYYDRCGGCQMQHMSHDPYKKWKEDKVITLFKERLPDSKPTLLPTQFINTETRRRSSFAVLKQNQKLILGYHQRRSKNITDIENCLILDRDIMTIAHEIKPYLMNIVRDSRVCDVFIQKVDAAFDLVITGPVGKKGEPDLDVRQACADLIQNTKIARISWRFRERREPEVLLEKHPLLKQTGSLHVPLPPLAFLQPSQAGEKALAKAMLEFLPSTSPLKCLDLFSGNGTFTGYLLEKGHSVAAYESDDSAVLSLKKSSFKNVHRRNLFKEPLEEGELNKYDVVVLDPPRAGAKEQIKHLAKSDVKTIIYISCNPASFARDAQELLENDYHFEKLQIVDQFPWSTHVEIATLFTKE